MFVGLSVRCLAGGVMIIVFYAFVFHQLDLANRRGMGEGGDMAV